MSTRVGNYLNENMLGVGLDDAAKPENNDLIADGTDYREVYFQETLFPFSKIGLTKDDETGVLEVLKGTIAGDAWEAYANVRGANLLDGILGAGGVGLDIEEAVTDPFGFVGSQIAGWMLQHVEPYRKVLDGLAGSPDMVKAYAKSWENIATALTGVSTDWQAALQADTASWNGAAADAYRARAAEMTDHINAAGGVAASMSEVIGKAQKIVEAIRNLVADILASLAGALIGYTIELALSLGAAGPLVAAQVLQRIGRDGLKITKLLADLRSALADLMPYVQQIGGVILKLLQPKDEAPA
ncbi:hypothetical protein [Nocardia brasiliensis]|uniref:WXG100-like domain-containing protein n=1 Tax=Nocardia brasiliensis TaxID=37326 RepID=UPI002456F238|nr:hypothetical protein [Nocardia brasiliensis]